MPEKSFDLAMYVALACKTEAPWIPLECAFTSDGKFAAIPIFPMPTTPACAVIQHRESRDIFRLNHSVMGFLTEIAEAYEAIEKADDAGRELDIVNFAEELGDSAWYYGPVCDQFHISFVMLIEVARRELQRNFDPQMSMTRAIYKGLREMAIGAGKVADENKRAIYYTSAEAKDKVTGVVGLKIVRPDVEKIKTGLLNHMRGVLRCASAIGKPIEEICETNIAKLKKRYGEKFAATEATERDLDGERAVLESAEE